MSGDPVVALVTNAIGYGVMMALEGRDELLRKLSSLPAHGSLFDALVGDAEGFIQTRSDLADAVTVHVIETLTASVDDQ